MRGSSDYAALWRVVLASPPTPSWRACPSLSGGLSSGLKLFGMSKCTAKTQKSRPRKCLGMRALQSMRVSSPLESVFAKNLGGGPPLACNGGKSDDELAGLRGTHASRSVREFSRRAPSAASLDFARDKSSGPYKIGDSGAAFRYNRARRTPAESAAWRSACNA